MIDQMLTVPFIRAANQTDRYLDEAMRRPVGVEFAGVTKVVMISIDEYERLTRRDRAGLYD